MPCHKKFADRSHPGLERATASLDGLDLFSVNRLGTEPEGIAITAKKVFLKIFWAILPERYAFALAPIVDRRDAPFASLSIALSSRKFACSWPSLRKRVSTRQQHGSASRNPRFRGKCRLSKMNQVDCFWSAPRRAWFRPTAVSKSSTLFRAAAPIAFGYGESPERYWRDH
jgi:hypothetical protein